MTACAFDTALTGGVGDRPRGGFTIASDRSYGARLALSGEAGCWYPERWTLDGPEPYAVPLPTAQPEEPDSELLPLADGQVLIHRRLAGHHAFSLLYPAGPGTGERPLGGIDHAEVSLLPPAPGGLCAFALGRGPRSTSVWLLFGGGVLAPQHLAEVPGRCTGGGWLDRTGRLLALDRELDGRTKTVVVDLRRGGETSPLLQITERSDDRLLLADPDSGLLLVRSDAPGEERLGWGVLGSARPVRFPDCLRPAGRWEPTPFAVQPGQVLTPESCAVAFRIDGLGGSGAGAGSGRPWVGVWRPAERRLREFPAPEGWLPGAGLWTREGELRLPYVTPQMPCGVARVRPPGVPGAAPRFSGGSWVATAPGGSGVAWVAEGPEAPGTPGGVASRTPGGVPSGAASGAPGGVMSAVPSGASLGAPVAADPSGAPEAPWRRDDSAAAWQPHAATPTWPPDGAHTTWRPEDSTGARRIARVTRVSEPSGRVSEPSGLMAEPSGPMSEPSGWVAEPSGRVSESSGWVAESSGRVPEPSGPAAAATPVSARVVQTPHTATPVAGIAARITPWTRVGGPGGPAPVRTTELTPPRPVGQAPELTASRASGPMPEPTPPRPPDLTPPRAPGPMPVRAAQAPMPVRGRAPMPVPERAPMTVREPTPLPVHERAPEPESGLGVEPWGGTGSWPGVEQEMGPEPDHDPGAGTGPALRPVPLQQAPLARPPQPRPPRWVRDHRRG
ncbi:hypothetical protein [Streptomyces malaysiensis]|uniref:hypothetical protein n=1 Tax=Streptomyces malaysiensis TaxID=92644 RepID=UPI003D2F9B94